MNKKVIGLSVLFLITSLFLFPGKKDDLWRQAITEKKLEVKFQLLKDYEQEYGKSKKDRMNKFLYYNLASTAFSLQKWDELIQFGETAVTFADLEGQNRLNLYLWLANAYKITKKDPEKAFHYAGETVNLCKEMIATQESTQQDEEKKKQFVNRNKSAFMAPALRLQTKMLFAKAKNDPKMLKEAANKAIEAYKADESKTSSDLAFVMAVKLYQKKFSKEAIEVVETIFDKEKPVSKHAQLLANLYIRLNNKAKAIEYFEVQYRLKKQAKMALKIGKMTYKQDINKGLKYFIDAYVLSGFNKESDGYKYAQQLHFNKNKGKEAGFKALIDQACKRLGKTAPATTAGDPGDTPTTETEIDETE